MTALDASFDGEPDRRDFLRWALCLLVVLALHAAIVAGLLMRSEPVEVADVSPPAVFVDLPAPEPQPAPSSFEAATAPTAEQPAPPVEEPAEATPPPPEPEPAPRPLEQVQPVPQPVEAPPPAEAAEAPLPPPPPPKPRVEPKKEPPPRQARPQPAQRAEPPPQARPQRSRPAEPPRGLALRLQPSFAPPAGLPSQAPPIAADIPVQPGSSTRTSVESFQRRLIEHLARYKRYPQSARLRREEGVVRVRFTMDAQGYVLGSRIVGSSGYSALDREVEDLLMRAQPLPPLPRDSGLSRFQVEMPVQFYIWQSR